MDPRTRVLAVDFGLALGAMALGVLATPRLSLGVLVLVLLGLVPILAALYIAEQTDALDVIDARRPGSLVAVAVATFVIALGLILGRLIVAWPSGPMLAGMGAALAGYRTAFGLYRPVPAKRLAQAGGGWRRRVDP